MPKERPILFNGEMVRAILDGRKTQTRRVMKPQPPKHTIAYEKGILIQEGTRLAPMRPCPYGDIGNHLWLRETWASEKRLDHLSPSAIGDAASIPLWYRADGDAPSVNAERGRWRPSIHMPRRASRITLRVTGVRVERVQSITPDDAWAEGIGWRGNGDTDSEANAVIDFAALWDTINAKRGYGWDTNPFVWVVTFRRVDA